MTQKYLDSLDWCKQIDAYNYSHIQLDTHITVRIPMKEHSSATDVATYTTHTYTIRN
jgi:hypothetical protein